MFLACACLLVGAVTGLRAEAATAPREAGVVTATRTIYRIDQAGGAVTVTVKVTVTNSQPDVIYGNSIRRATLDRFGVPVLTEAVNLAATEGGRALAVRRVQLGEVPVVVASIDLVPDLLFGDTQRIDLTYTLPVRPPRSAGFSRVNTAFATFPIFVTGDRGKVDVEVIAPKRFEVDVVGSDAESSEDGDVVIHRITDVGDPSAFFATVVARDDDALVSLPVALGDRKLTVLGWPGDDEWATFVADKIKTGVPALEQLIDLPWPGQDGLEVVETSSPYAYGFAGWYLPSEALVEIGDELDAEVILHELSHLWFNDDLFRERWINEGLAEVFASLALERLGDPVRPLDPVEPTAPGRIALLDWSDPDLQLPISREQEAFGYNASRAVFDRITAEIGVHSLAAVLQAADHRTWAYPGDGEPLRYKAALDWRELLDLLEGPGESDGAVATFSELVLSDDERGVMGDRAAARVHYDALLDSGDGWTAPRVVRADMGRWLFTRAGRAMDAAEAVLAVREDMVRVLASSGIHVPSAMEEAYETAGTVPGLDDVSDGALDAAIALAGADRAKHHASGPLAVIGMLGRDSGFDRATKAFELGDYKVAVERGRGARSSYDAATTAGARRLVVLLVLMLATGTVVRRRLARPPRPAAVAADALSSEDDLWER